MLPHVFVFLLVPKCAGISQNCCLHLFWQKNICGSNWQPMNPRHHAFQIWTLFCLLIRSNRWKSSLYAFSCVSSVDEKWALELICDFQSEGGLCINIAVIHWRRQRCTNYPLKISLEKHSLNYSTQAENFENFHLNRSDARTDHV